jgi:hypothetical protein
LAIRDRRATGSFDAAEIKSMNMYLYLGIILASQALFSAELSYKYERKNKVVPDVHTQDPHKKSKQSRLTDQALRDLEWVREQVSLQWVIQQITLQSIE